MEDPKGLVDSVWEIRLWAWNSLGFMNNNLQPTGQAESGGQFSHPRPHYTITGRKGWCPWVEREFQRLRRGGDWAGERGCLWLWIASFFALFSSWLAWGHIPATPLALIQTYYCYYYPFLAPLENRYDTAAVKLKDACSLEEKWWQT